MHCHRNSYDHLGRLTYKDLPTGEYDVTYGYDLLGRSTSAATSLQTLTFGYDALNRMTSQGGPLGTVSTQYDLAGRRTRLTWPDSFYASYDYLVTGEVSAVRENGATSGTGVLATYAYDDLGRRTSLTRGNGTTTNYGFDAASRLISLGLDLDGATTTNDLSLGFSYTPAGQIAGTTRSNDGYAWRGAANRNDASSVNGLNQTTSVGAGSIGYDSKGNLNSTGSNSYSYSSENLLLTGPSSASLTYDPVLRLYQESGSSVATRLFQYDGQAMIGEYDTSSVLQRRYVHGPGTDEPLVEYDKSGSNYARVWLHADERGSVVAQSNDSGATTAINSYDEYGVPAAGNVGRFQYTGQSWLPTLALYYYKARVYSARLGRFMQTDPIGYGDGLNSYSYTRSDPINRSDFSGTDSSEDINNSKYWSDNEISGYCDDVRNGDACSAIDPVATSVDQLFHLRLFDSYSKSERTKILAIMIVHDIIVKATATNCTDCLNFRSPVERFWGYPHLGGMVTALLTLAQATDCPNGTTVQRFSFPSNFASMISSGQFGILAHDHPGSYGAEGEAPGGGDASIPFGGTPLIGITKRNSWLITHSASGFTLDLLTGSWPTGFDPVQWVAARNRTNGSAKGSNVCQ